MAVIDTDPGFLTKTSFIQLGYGIWVNLASVAIGLAIGFPAVQIPQLNSPDSEILVTVEDTSWIASVLALFCPIGCMLSGNLMDKFGRSTMIMCCQLPMLVGWLYTGVSRSAKSIIIGRAITGIGCGMAMGPPRLYTAEISLPNMRGLLGAFPNVFLSLGIALQALMGIFIEWDTLCYICGGYNVMLFLSYLFLQETPYYLLLRDTTENAKKALTCFRATKYHIDKELNRLINYKQDNNIRSLHFCEKFKRVFSRSSCIPFTIIITYTTLGHLSGISIFTFWTIELLQLANSSFDAYAGNVFIAVTRLIFGIIASILLFRARRRTMALTSATGLSMVCIVLGLYLYAIEDPSIVPLVLFMMYTAFACLGFYVLPFLLMSELYPLQVRGTLTGISISIVNITVFWSTLCFPYLRDSIGLPNILLIFGGFALIAAIFLYCFLPETQNLTLQEIEEFYSKSRPTLISQRNLITALQNHTTKTLMDNEKENLNRRSFVEITSIKSSSLSSVGSRKSVTLMIGDKHFKSLTAAENEELKRELGNFKDQTADLHTSGEPEEMPLASFFFDEPIHSKAGHKRGDFNERNGNKKKGEFTEHLESSNVAKNIKANQKLDSKNTNINEELSKPGNSKQSRKGVQSLNVTNIKHSDEILKAGISIKRKDSFNTIVEDNTSSEIVQHKDREINQKPKKNGNNKNNNKKKSK